MATITDIARECGVSIATVSKALNDKGRMRAETRNRIMEAVGRLNYDIASKKQVVRPVITPTIGLVLPRSLSIKEEYYYRAVTTAFTTSLEYGYDCKIFHQEDLKQRVLDSFYKGKEQLGCQALILYSPNEGWEEYLDNLHAWQLPVAVVRRRSGREGIITLTNDDTDAFTLAMNHLLDTGHTCIATLVRPQHAGGTTITLRTAWHAALEERGLAPDPRLNLNTTTGHTVNTADLVRLAQEGLNVTAVITLDDILAIHTISTLQVAGYRVPEDVAVIGYGGSPMSAAITPALSTVRIPIEEMVAAACRALANWSPENANAQSSMTFKNELIVRHSTETTRSADSDER